jgi:hypothetical protein
VRYIGTLAVVLSAGVMTTGCVESPNPTQPDLPPLTVTLAASQTSCYPRPSQACSIDFAAVVPASEARSLRYTWSGCGSGTARTSTCSIDRPGDVTIAVEVTDQAGQTTRATGTARGANLPPSVEIGDFVLWESWDDTRRAGSFEVSGRISDPEVPTGDCGPGPDMRAVTASGICSSGYARCTVGNLEVGALKIAAAGECSLTLTGIDEWGVPATVTKTFQLPRR